MAKKMKAKKPQAKKSQASKPRAPRKPRASKKPQAPRKPRAQKKVQAPKSGPIRPISPADLAEPYPFPYSSLARKATTSHGPKQYSMEQILAAVKSPQVRLEISSWLSFEPIDIYPSNGFLVFTAKGAEQFQWGTFRRQYVTSKGDPRDAAAIVTFGCPVGKWAPYVPYKTRAGKQVRGSCAAPMEIHQVSIPWSKVEAGISSQRLAAAPRKPRTRKAVANPLLLTVLDNPRKDLFARAMQSKIRPPKSLPRPKQHKVSKAIRRNAAASFPYTTAGLRNPMSEEWYLSFSPRVTTILREFRKKASKAPSRTLSLFRGRMVLTDLTRPGDKFDRLAVSLTSVMATAHLEITLTRKAPYFAFMTAGEDSRKNWIGEIVQREGMSWRLHPALPMNVFIKGKRQIEKGIEKAYQAANKKQRKGKIVKYIPAAILAGILAFTHIWMNNPAPKLKPAREMFKEIGLTMLPGVKTANAAKCPYKQGQKIPRIEFEKWLAGCGCPDLQKKYRETMASYKRFHKALPTTIIFEMLELGGDQMLAPEVLYSAGKSDVETYTPEKNSAKAPHSYYHDYKDKPEVLINAKGSLVIKPLRKRAKVTDWFYN